MPQANDPPTSECWCCGGTRYYRVEGGPCWVCETCHPWLPGLRLVARHEVPPSAPRVGWPVPTLVLSEFEPTAEPHLARAPRETVEGLFDG